MDTTLARLWRTAGGMLIAFVVLTFAGVVPQPTLMLGDAPSKGHAALVASSMTDVFAGGYVEVLAWLVLLAGALLLARLLRGASPTSEWLSSCMSGSIAAAVAVTVSTGFAAGAAAVYNGHHGVPLATVTAINDIRNIGFFLTGSLLGLFCLATAGAAHVTRAMPRWVVVSSALLGVVYLVTAPLARTGAMNIATLGGFLWFAAVGVAALRVPARTQIVSRSTPVAA